ncbi:MAG: lysophospholipid acyltransferase family protein [Nitrospinae bacterium]|nr:lysophospholipid acyltransferase family protein [Nitrospinota bacterium]
MVVKERLGRDILRLVVWYPLRWLILGVPIRWGLAILGFMGDLHFALSRGKKRELAKNLANVRGETFAASAQGEAAIREYMRNHYVDRLFILIFPRFGAAEVERFIEIEGRENLDAALAAGKGAILVHGHFGPAHVPLVALARLGYKMKQVGFPSDEGLSWVGRNVAFRLRLKYEAMMPAEVMMADGFLRPAFKWLKDGGALMITGDGTGTGTRIGRHHLFRFHGKPVMFPLGPAILAAKTGAKLLPMFIIPGAAKPYRIVIGKPILVKGDSPDAAVETMGEFLTELERYTSRHPGYMHFLDRFSEEALIQKDAQ